MTPLINQRPSASLIGLVYPHACVQVCVECFVNPWSARHLPFGAAEERKPESSSCDEMVFSEFPVRWFQLAPATSCAAHSSL